MSSEPNGKANLTLLLAGLGVLCTLIAGGWVIMDNKIKLAVLEATAGMTAEVASLRAEAFAQRELLQSRIIEIESQFRSQDKIINIHLADEKRTLALLWPKVFGEQYPTAIYYPEIARDPK